ncbi:MAG: NYN domain-containing protein [Gammaproteobacteria bacterium]|nr:NYN domain-containing protein [Gammaproteobacteria bacterium]
MKNTTHRVIIYIDGFNFYYGIRSLGQQYKWLDVEALSQSFIEKDEDLIAVKFFTAKLNGRNEAADRQSIYWDALSKHCPKVQIIEGYFAKARKCKHCDNKNNEEKQTDVNIACEILQDCYEDKFDVAYLVSGDSDLVTPIKKALLLGETIIIANPPNRKSMELSDNATSCFDISENRLRKHQLPEQIPTKRNPLKRPEKWKK